MEWNKCSIDLKYKARHFQCQVSQQEEKERNKAYSNTLIFSLSLCSRLQKTLRIVQSRVYSSSKSSVIYRSIDQTSKTERKIEG